MALLAALVARLGLGLRSAVFRDVALQTTVVTGVTCQRGLGTQTFEHDLPSWGAGLRTVGSLVADYR